MTGFTQAHDSGTVLLEFGVGGREQVVDGRERGPGVGLREGGGSVYLVFLHYLVVVFLLWGTGAGRIKWVCKWCV